MLRQHRVYDSHATRPGASAAVPVALERAGVDGTKLTAFILTALPPDANAGPGIELKLTAALQASSAHETHLEHTRLSSLED
jgi:hypothetical protein